MLIIYFFAILTCICLKLDFFFFEKIGTGLSHSRWYIIATESTYMAMLKGTANIGDFSKYSSWLSRGLITRVYGRIYCKILKIPSIKVVWSIINQREYEVPGLDRSTARRL